MLKLVKILIKLIVGLTVLIFGATFAVSHYPGLVWVFKDKDFTSPYCSPWKIIADSRRGFGSDNRTVEIRAASRIAASADGLDYWETPLGNYWIPGGNDEILPILLTQQESDIYGDGEWGVHAGDVVVECGAHVGVFTRKALDRGARLVVAIEPSPDPLACLRKNLESEIAQGRVVVVPKGVWDSETELTFFKNVAGGAGDSFVIRSEAAIPLDSIPVTTIDRIISDLGLANVDLIKTDIKGATERALIGAKATIAKYHPRFAISTEEAADRPDAIVEVIHSLSPDYEVMPGACTAHDHSIFTSVVFFR